MLVVSLPNGLKSKLAEVEIPLDSSPEKIREAWGLADAGHLIEVALVWSNLQQLDPTTQFWIVRLWSPGLPIIEVILIWLYKVTSIPFSYFIIFFTILIWMILFYLVVKNCRSKKAILTVFIIVNLYIHTFDFEWILRSGIFYTEGISIGLLLVGLTLYLQALIKNNRSIATLVFAGVFVGFSIIVRHIIDIPILFTLFIATFLILVFNKRINVLKKELFSFDLRKGSIKLTKSKEKKIHSANLTLLVSSEIKRTLIKVITILLIGLTVTIPWRLVAQQVYGSGPGVMSEAPRLTGKYLWVDDQTNSTFFWSPNGINWACKIDKIKCKEINSNITSYTVSDLRNEAVKSALFNPIKYASERFKYFSKYWQAESNGFSLNSFISWSILFLPFTWILMRKSIGLQKYFGVLVFSIPILFVLTGQLLIIHYESRYFIIIRMIILWTTFGLFAIRDDKEAKIKI
jgi:hypothetical protein